MATWILTRHIDAFPFLAILYAVAAAFGCYLIVAPPVPRALPRTVGAALGGGALGYLCCWLVGDVGDAFGIVLTPVTRAWVAVAFGGVAVAVVDMIGTRWWRVVIAAVSIPVFVVTAAAGVNVDFGAYPTLAAAFGLHHYRRIGAEALQGHATARREDLLAGWRPAGPLPAHGTTGRVRIPAVVSHFPARDAVVYLPPAALVSNAPALPVIVALSGQPGRPADMFVSGRMPSILDRYAAAHHGLAPIVVVPDQLGAASRNPMCVDSPLGRSATYLTRDVPAWIRSHLRVESPARDWGVLGFSQGGTCAIQLGAGHPDLFRTIVDISGQEAPTIGRRTVAVAFGGSRAAYDRAKPLTILADHAPYRGTTAIFGVGQHDARYGPQARTVLRAARSAGMRTSFIVSPGTAHDWHTVRYVLERALPRVADRLLGPQR